LKELAAKRMRFGYRRLTAVLVREGTPVNHKRVYRLYREEGLAMRDSATTADPTQTPSSAPDLIPG
jgi:putative transposase